MNKKLLSIIVASSLAASFAPTSFAVGDTDQVADVVLHRYAETAVSEEDTFEEAAPADEVGEASVELMAVTEDGFSYSTSGTNATINGYTGGQLEVEIPAKITAGDKEYTVVKLDNTFRNNTAVTKVTIPNTVTEIGNNTFNGCTSLAEVKLPSTLTSIGSSAFYKCTSLVGIDIPAGVKSVGTYAFQTCTSLEYITLPEGVEKVQSTTFQGCTALKGVVLPSTVTQLDSAAFENCTSLEYIYFKCAPPKFMSNTFNKVPKESVVFYYSLSKEELYTSDETQTLFKGYALMSVDDYFEIQNDTIVSTNASMPDRSTLFLPESFLGKPVTKLAPSAFTKIESAEVIVIPPNIKSLGNASFPSGLKELYFRGTCPTELPELPAGVTVFVSSENRLSFESSAYKNNLNDPVKQPYNFEMFEFDTQSGIITGYSKPKISRDSVNIPSNMYGIPVVGIGPYAFAGYTYIQNVQIPKSVKIIGTSAFEGCSNLATINGADDNDPNKNTVYASLIGPSAFSDCVSLTEITMQDLSFLGDSVFWNCRELDKVTIKGDTDFEYVGVYNTGKYDEATKKEIQLEIPVKGAYIGPFAFAGNYEYGNDASTGGANGVAPALKQGVVLENIGYIDEFSFNGSGMEKIEIPEGVQIIKCATFGFCPDLSEVKLPKSLLYIEGGVNYNQGDKNRAKKCDGAFAYCEKLSYIQMPENLLDLGTLTFAKSGLVQIDFAGEALTSIPYGTFRGCASLEAVELPEGIVSIDNSKSNNSTFGAFSECTALKSVTMPSTLQKIGTHAFYKCTALDKVACESGAISDSLVSVEKEAFSGCKTLGNTAPVAFPNTFTSIGESAFRDCTALGTAAPIELPSSLALIDKSAFSNCTSLSLKDGKIPPSVTTLKDSAFYGCTSLTKAVIPPSITEIPQNAFQNSGLESITIPDTVAKISNSSFSGCKALTSVKAAAGETELIFDKSSFRSCPALEKLDMQRKAVRFEESSFDSCKMLAEVSMENAESVFVGKRAFALCSALQKSGLPTDAAVELTMQAYTESGLVEFDVPNTVSVLPEGLFYKCKSLEAVNLGTSLAEISGTKNDKGSFQACTALKTIELPESLSSLGEYAFAESGLEKIKMPDSVTTIPLSCFENCKDLREVTLGKNTRTIGGEVKLDSNGEYKVDTNGKVTSEYHGAFKGCTSLKTVEIPETVTEIKPFAFAESGVEYMELPYTISIINDGTFYKCDKLKNVVFSDMLKEIGKYSFSGCTSLREVEIPGSVTNINTGAFLNDTALESVRIGDTENDKTTTFGARALSGCENLSYLIFSGKTPRYNSELFGESTKPTILYFSRLFDETNTNDKSWKANFDMVAIDEQFEYSKNEDNTYSISKYTGTLPIAIIPAITINDAGKSVQITGIADNALDGTLLKTVSIPKTITSLKSSTFYGAENLEKINVSSLNGYYNSIDGVLYKNDGTVLVYCPSKKIGTINIAFDVKNIEQGAFYKNSLSGINVSEENEDYSSADGVLVNKEGTSIVAYPNKKGSPYTVTENITSIEPYAFTDSSIVVMFDTQKAPDIKDNAIAEGTSLQVYPDAEGFDDDKYSSFEISKLEIPLIAEAALNETSLSVTYKNFTEAPVTCKSFAAVYNKKGALVGVTAAKDLSMEVNTTHLLDFELPAEGDTVKIFVWSDMENITPVDFAKTVVVQK